MNFAFFLHYLKEKYPCNENVSNSIQGAGLFPHPFYIGLPERFCVKETAQYNFFQCCPKRFIGTMNMRLL